MKRFRFPTKKLAYVAVLTAIAIVLNIFSFDIGLPYSLKLSFVALPCFIAGAFLGPIYGFSVGFLGDFLGFLIRPFGNYIPLIGVATGLLGLLPGLIFRFTKLNDNIKIALSFVLSLIICTAGVNTFALWHYFSGHSKTFWAYLVLRLPFQSIIMVINATLAYTVFFPLKKYVMKPIDFIPKEHKPADTDTVI